MNGEMQRFESTKNSMVYDDRRKEFVDEGNINSMPGVSRPAAADDDADATELGAPDEDDLAGGEGAGVI